MYPEDSGPLPMAEWEGLPENLLEPIAVLGVGATFRKWAPCRRLVTERFKVQVARGQMHPLGWRK